MSKQVTHREHKHDLECLVFSTNVDTRLKAARLVYILEKTNGIISWNLDMDDCDNVLRLKFRTMNIHLLEHKLSSFGIEIEELPIW